MKGLTNHMSSGNNKFNKLIHWGRLITVTGSAQMLVQGVALISGILIIRILPTQEYALYTLVNTMLGTMTVLADGGIGAGVMSQGGKVWQDKDKLGSVLVTGINLRKKFAIISLLIAIPVLFYLLWHHGANLLNATLIVLCLIPAFIAALSDSLLEISLKLRQDINPLQKNQIWVNILRLILIFPLFLAPWAALAIIASGIPRILGNIKLKKIVSRHVDWEQPSDPVIQKKILSGVKKMLPGAIYYCISGQISIWLISVFGNTKAIAQIGALSRLAMVLTLISTVFNTLITPRFSRLPERKKIILSKFVLIVVGVIGLMLLIIGLVFLFPHAFLMLLGHGYSNLSSELVLSVIGSCATLLGGLLFSLSASRGWILNPFILIGSNILTVVGGSFLLNISTLRGVLYFNIVIGIVPFVLFMFYILYRIMTIKPDINVDAEVTQVMI
jgi:O-antigen/teichoic acid export membrane protein